MTPEAVAVVFKWPLNMSLCFPSPGMSAHLLVFESPNHWLCAALLHSSTTTVNVLFSCIHALHRKKPLDFVSGMKVFTKLRCENVSLVKSSPALFLLWTFPPVRVHWGLAVCRHTIPWALCCCVFTAVGLSDVHMFDWWTGGFFCW